MRNFSKREKKLNTLKKWNSIIEALNKEYQLSKIIKQLHQTKQIKNEQLFHRY